MADREKTPKKKKRAYLDDFEKDLSGNYQYRGKHYRYADKTPRGKTLAQLWLCCGLGAALTVGAGVLPGATAHAPVYLLLPYMAALVLALYAVVLLARLTRAGARVRAYIHEQTAQKLPSLCIVTSMLCGVSVAGQGIAVFAGDGQIFGTYGIFMLFTLAACAAFAVMARLVRQIAWEEEE